MCNRRKNIKQEEEEIRNLKQKLIIITILILIVISNIQPEVYGMFQANIQYSHRTDFYLTYNGARFYQSVIYFNHDNQKHYAYCLNADRIGAETEGYIADIHEHINNDAIWRVMRHGFPYCSPQTMGLQNEDEAFYVTKMAIYCVTGQRDINLFGSYNGNDHVLNSLRNLVNIGFNSTETKQSPYFIIDKVGNMQIDSINNNYLSQTLKVSSTMELGNFSTIIPQSSIDEVIITDMSNNIKSEFGATEQFKVLIPIEKLNKDINTIINITTSAKSYPVFFALAPNETLQNYALSFDAFELSANHIILNEKTNLASIEITKKDEETGEKLEGVKFELRKETGEIIGTYITNSDGTIKIPDLHLGNYILKEISAKDNYVLNEKEINIALLYNQKFTIDITNEYQKGNFKISKIDQDNNEIKLDGVEFELLNSDRELIGNFKTNNNGEIYIENLKVGKYILKETKTKEEYMINENELEIEIIYNETREIIIQNKRKPEPKLLPKTGVNNKILSSIEDILKSINFCLTNQMFCDNIYT